jgi:hypothetical protein
MSCVTQTDEAHIKIEMVWWMFCVQKGSLKKKKELITEMVETILEKW